MQWGGIVFERGPSKLWPTLLGRTCSWSPGAAPVVKKLTEEFGITASDKLIWNPSPNPNKSCMIRPSDTASVSKVSMSKQGQYVLVCYSCVFLHKLQVGCLLYLDWHPALLEQKPALSSCELLFHIAVWGKVQVTTIAD